MNFIGGKTYNTGTADIILYIKHFCDKIPVGGMGTENLKIALIPTKQTRLTCKCCSKSLYIKISKGFCLFIYLYLFIYCFIHL